jgi:hypothetical protein
MAKRRGNPVAEAKDVVGSAIKVAALVDSTPQTVHAWVKAGKMPGRGVLIFARAWAQATGAGPADELAFARRLAGLD